MGRRRSALPPNTPVHDHHGLCLALGGDTDSFTGDLLRLVAKADPVNRTRLMLAFPGEVVAWEHWVAKAPAITAGEIVRLAEAAEALLFKGDQTAAWLLTSPEVPEIPDVIREVSREMGLERRED